MRDPAELDRRRAERNQALLDRMRAGEACQDPASMSFFPPRPIIRKDPREVARALGLPDLPVEMAPRLARWGGNGKTICGHGVALTEVCDDCQKIVDRIGGQDSD